MNKIIIIEIIAISFLACVRSHADMVEPISRCRAYLEYPDIFPDNSDQDCTRWCATKKETNSDNVKCGICGPIYNDDITSPAVVKIKGVEHTHWSFEKGSPMYRGNIVKIYKKGETIDIFVNVRAGHGGHFQFRICNADGLNTDPDMECFEKNILAFEDGSEKFWMREVKGSRYKFTDTNGVNHKLGGRAARVILPADLTCKHCILQVIF